MRIFLTITLLFCLGSGHVSADTEWPPEAYAELVARANARHAGEHHDPQERDPHLKATFAAADAIAVSGLRNDPPTDPIYIALFWRVKKTVLFRRFGIHWRSPAELNPKRSYPIIPKV